MTYQKAIGVHTRAKLRVSDFLLLDEAGVFDGNTRTELLDGEIWVLNALHLPHGRAYTAMMLELGLALRAMGSPLELIAAPSTKISETSLPEPDMVVVEPGAERLLSGRFVRLAVEVSDTTLKMDMGLKARLYAAAGIPEYWVLNVKKRVIHQMWSPEGERWSEVRDVSVLSGITTATIDGLALPGFDIG